MDHTHFSFREKIFSRNQKSTMNDRFPMFCFFVGIKQNSRKLVKNGSKTIFSFCRLMEYSLATSSRHMANGITSCIHHNKPTEFHLHHRDLRCHYCNQHLHLQENRKSIVESYISLLCNTKKLVKNQILKVSFPGHLYL